MNNSNFERFLFRKSKSEKSVQPRYGAIAISSQLQRGDQNIAEDDWESAENCYVAAYFLNGGTGPVILAKIELAKQLRSIVSEIAESGARVESARYSGPTLRLLVDELDEVFETVYSLRMELPRSQRLINLEMTLDTAMRKAKHYLAEQRK